MSEIIAPIITDSTGQAIAAAISGAVSKADKSDIAPEFSTSADYAKGSMVYYQGTLYEFTAAHNHAAWTGSDVIAVKVSSEINTLKSGLTKHAITFTAETGYTIEDKGSFVIGNVAYLNFFIKSATRITSRVNVATMSVGMPSGNFVAITCPSSYVVDSTLNGYANVMIGLDGESTITVGDYITQENGCAQIDVNCVVVIN